MSYRWRSTLCAKACVCCLGLLISLPLAAEEGQWGALFEVNSKLAAQDNLEAQYRLGEMYEEGRGTKKDLQVARRWYEKAAANGHAGAAYKLGLFYEQGEGVAVDLQRARDWYGKAAAQGHYLAKAQLQRLKRPNAAPTAEEQAALTTAREAEARQAREEAASARRRAEQQRALEAQRRAEAERLRARAEGEQRAVRPGGDAQPPSEPVAAPPVPVVELAQPEAAASGGQTEASDEEARSFKMDPCKSPAARYMSTCR